MNSLGFAALLILLAFPGRLFTPGFQLSFAAVFSIAFFYEKVKALVRKTYPSLADRPFIDSLVSVSLLTLSATLGTIPLTAFYFDRVSMVGLLSNLLIVPLSGIFISLNFTFLLLALISAPLASVYSAAAQITGLAILKVNSILGSLAFSSITIGDSAVLFGILYLIWLAAVGRFGGDSLRKKAVLGILLGANMILFTDIFGDRSEGRLYALDVGQGDAVYMELPDGKNMLLDAGAKYGRFDAGSAVIVPFLRRRGINSLDLFVITHLHSDHIGGAESVLRSVKVKCFVAPDQAPGSETSRRTFALVRTLGIPLVRAGAGLILDSGRTCRVYVLHPNRKYVGEGGLSYRTRFNDGSIVLKVCVGGSSLLLSGDVERRAERDMLKIYGNFLSSSLLKVAHHGSATSSSPEFLDEVRPKYAIISVGAGNKFGHPSPMVIRMMSGKGIYVLRTDSLGAVCFRIGADYTRLVHWR